MESVSRPPHRRKHSAAATAFPAAGKNPYDDVLLSRGGKGRALEAHEYTEIFSGSPTSIPVLDISALEELGESGDGQVSALDYANIFGGLRNDDVAAPYEEVFGGSAKKDKPRIPADSKPSLRQSSSLQTREASEILADSQPSLRQSSSLHKRKSTETSSNHSIPGVEQQFNVSFNKTHQRDNDASNGKTHIAQLHSVPGFTFFVNETHRQLDREDPKHVPPLKRDVSRTWSFSGEVKDVKGKHGVSLDKSRVADMSPKRNEANIKSHHSKMPLSSNHPPNPSNSKDPICVRASKFASKEDASKNDGNEYSPPFLDEEFDENSVAAASAAALKKAIEQAQESIRLAKMIMERKKAGHEGRSKSRSRGRLKDLSKKTEIEHEVSGFKDTLSRDEVEHEILDAKFTGVDGKGGRSLCQKDIHPNDVNSGVETAQKVETAKDHGEEFMCEDGLFTLSSSQLQMNIQLERNEEHIIEAPRREATQCRTGNNDGFILSMGKVAPDHMRIETGNESLEQRDASVSNAGHEVLLERDLNRSPRMRDIEEIVVEPELYQVNFDHAKGPEVIVEPLEGVSDTSHRTLKLEKVLDEDDKNWRIGLDEQVFEERENDAYGLGKNDMKFEEREEVHNVANLAEPESAVIAFLKESWNLMGNKVPEQGEINGNPGDASYSKENECNNRGKYDGENGMSWKEEFECKMRQEEVLEEEITLREPTVHPAMVEFEKKVEIWELEIDKKQNHHDADEPKLHEELEKDQIEERHRESQCMETSNLARAQKNESFRDVEETTSTLRGTGRSEEDHNEKRHENSSGYEADERQVTEACNFAEAQKNDAVWDLEETNITLRGSGRSEDHNEEIHEGTSGHGVDDIGMEPSSSVEVQKNEPVWDVGGANDTTTSDDNNEERHAKTSEHEANENLVTKAFNFAEIQDNDLFWCVDETNSPLKAMGTREGHQYEERHKVPSEHEADRSQVTEANKFAEVWKNEPFWDVEETNSTLKETGRSEEHHNAFEFQEAAYDVCADEAVEANNGGVDLKNTAEKYQETVESNMENDTVPASMGSQIYKGVEAENPFPLEDTEIPGIESLRRIASEENFVQSQQNSASEGHLSGNKTENVGVAESDSKENSSEEEHAFATDSEIHCTAQYYADSNLSDVISSDNRSEEYDLTDERPVLEQTSDSSDKGSVSTCSPEEIDRLSSHGSEGCAESVKDVTPSKEEPVNVTEASTERKCTDQSEGLFSESQSKPKETKEFMEDKRIEGTISNIENSEDPIGNFETVEKDTKENVQDFEKQERLQRIEAIKRAREREKERQVVERAIREARERAFAEARERAGKAAAEKAAAEVQHKVTTEAQQKLEKPPAAKQPDKVSTEAKLRAERAAVEKVLAEARGRALEKALSQKTSTETRTAADRSKGLKHSFSSSDLENSTAPESAQRRKARLERHQRIMERAAKALAEKNMRDFLAQKEQAERNRLAESLDADIKRWATGKEGNLRALLSTLQYILGRDSGWQPIPLTEIITPAAVKKAYRKATLYVHPDKLQQRGASIRQKYICEKVFDLLKAAWNKFNSEER